MRVNKMLALFLLLAIIAWPISASALTIPLDTEFGQGLDGDYGEVILTDLGNAIKFDIIINNPDPFGGTIADLTAFYFNVDTDFPEEDISFDFVAPNPFEPTVSIDYDHLPSSPNKTDGDGIYDIFLDYSGHMQSDDGNFSDTCGGAGCLQSVIFTISVAGENLAIENFATFPPSSETQSTGGSKGHFTVAARIRRINTLGEDSAWVGGNPIPEPATALLLGSGLLGLLGLSRRRRFLKEF